ncbi:MAG: hypothetical protein AB1898_29250 [Acidobacteriota bacterium]
MKSNCHTHTSHTHQHDDDCEHTLVEHEDHTDYLHDGHLHHLHEEHVDDHTIAVGKRNPSACTPDHDCGGHEKGHRHGKGCGHEAVPHGDHIDYLVDGHLHRYHDGHCDDHGALKVLKRGKPKVPQS